MLVGSVSVHFIGASRSSLTAPLDEGMYVPICIHNVVLFIIFVHFIGATRSSLTALLDEGK